MAWEPLIIFGTVGFTLALLPQVVRTLRLGRADDMSIGFVLLVILASGATLIYWLQRDEPPWVYGGFIANILVWTVVLWYRLFPRPGTVPGKDS